MADQAWITRTKHDGGIIELGLNRAPVNALDPESLMGMRDCIKELGHDDAVRAIVLTSPLSVFSAGLNLKAAQGFDANDQRAIVAGLNHGFLALFACTKPVVVAVNGAAIAGGLFFVLAADHRIAVPRAQFGLAEVRVGVGFPAGPLGIAQATLDAATCRRLMLRGQPIGAEAALAAGIVDEVVDPETLNTRALDVARELAVIPPKAYARVKAQLRQGAIDQITAAVAAEEAAGEDWFTDETAPAMARMIG